MRPKIGLLAFYLELYDRVLPGMRPQVEKYYRTVASEFSNSGIDVVTPDICRIKKEFTRAMDHIRNEGADAVVMLYLAYSPSLESADILIGSDLPLIILDTTPKYDFDSRILPDDILYNHGIHGVQDMCSILKRNGKRFILETGHWKESDILERVIRHINGCLRLILIVLTPTIIWVLPTTMMGILMKRSDFSREPLSWMNMWKVITIWA